MFIPQWVFLLIVSLAVSGIGTAITIAMNWARVSVRLATLQASADALHDRVDELDAIAQKLARDVAVLKKLDEREFFHSGKTAPQGVPVVDVGTDPPPTRPRHRRDKGPHER